MPAASLVCYQCGHRQARPAAAAVGPAPAQPAPFAAELLRQDLTPEQLLARLQLMRSVYVAGRRAALLWTKGIPCFCHYCHRPLAARSDAYGLESSTLARLEEYLAHVAKRLEAQGKQRFAWPLSAESLKEISRFVLGDNAQSMRLFCRSCVERILKSRRIAGAEC
jgi:hypothetical protein